MSRFKVFMQGFVKGVVIAFKLSIMAGFVISAIGYMAHYIGEATFYVYFANIVLLALYEIKEQLEKMKIPMSQKIDITFVSPDDPKILATLVRTETEVAAVVTDAAIGKDIKKG